ncbi:hypothetical protein B296_00054319 [Ensete ventricosum]|uniref:Uncharacterized protein n=1 Tax=Ensete ventricosum TaxID=4639 RepID=A0A426Y4F4_ENSVE|nr:hypothetical protein B296_00054319 [Ensete ventricosum]
MNPTARGTGVLFFYVFFFSFFLFLPQSIVDDRNRPPISAVPPGSGRSAWTDQQRAIGAREGWSYRLVFTGRLLGLILLADALFFGAQRLGPLLQEWRSH